MRPDLTQHADRVRTFDGVHNVRDLGGLVNDEGRRVRSGLLYRSDYPGFVDVAHAVETLGLRSVVDLRQPAEAQYECVDWSAHGVDYLAVPISAGRETSWHAKYQGYLTHRPDLVVEAVRKVITPEDAPVLFHCAAGKDRTGTVAALVLGLLGVPDEEIIADYVLTEGALTAILGRLSGRGPYAEMLSGSSYDDQLPRAENMRGLLDYLHSEGGPRAWLRAHALSDGDVDRFRAATLEG
ncbi:tyrosine-protein phosphatase [Nocardioides sp. GXZ039]|uniref:tyrosine-protein phosphatase n=1 Tax=Nocardioides sp. GXZ039 TaxID=3136018 RepID=UPI0030F4A27B